MSFALSATTSQLLPQNQLSTGERCWQAAGGAHLEDAVPLAAEAAGCGGAWRAKTALMPVGRLGAGAL